MKRALRWLRRFVVTLLALTVVAIVVVLIVLHTAWGRDFLRGKIESALRDQFPGGASIGELDGSVLGEIVLHDVVIRGTDNQPQYTVKTLRVKVALLPLIGKTARVESLIAEDVAVDVHARPPSPPKPPSPPSTPSWSVALPHVEVHRAAVAIASEREPVHLDDIDVAGELQVPAGAPMTGWVSATATWRERRAPIAAMVAARIDGGTVGIPIAVAAVGGVRLSAAGVTIDGDRIAGVFSASGSPEAVAALAPGVEIPGDATVTVEAEPDRPIRVAAKQGDAWLRGSLRVDRAAKRVTGAVVGTALAFESFTKGRLKGTGTALVGGELAWEHLDFRGGAVAMGVVEGGPGAVISIGGALVGDRGDVVAIVGGAGDASAIAHAQLSRGDGALAIVDAELRASTSDVKKASGDVAPITGVLATTLHATGALRPKLDLEITGAVTGKRVHYAAKDDDIGAATLTAKIDKAIHVPSSPLVAGSVELGGVTRGSKALGWLAIDGRNRSDGKLDLNVHARPASAAVRADVHALVGDGWLALARHEPGASVTVDLGKHQVRADSGVAFAGAGGQITVDDKAVSLRDLKSSGGGGEVAVSGKFDRATQDLDARVDAQRIATSMVDPQYRGSVGAKALLTRRGGQWGGTATVTGTGVARAPDQPAFDAEARVSLDGRRVKLDAGARNLMLGAATASLDVTGPRDVLDPDAWRRVSRADIRAVKLTANRVDLGGVGHVFAANDKLSGVADGELALGPDGVRGSIRVHGIHAQRGGDADVIVTIDPGERGELATKAKVSLADVGADAAARVALPDRLFDPEAWRTAGRAMLRDGTVEIADLAVDPKLLARFGIDSPMRARVSAKVTIAAAAASAHVVADVRDARGGSLAKPVAIHAEATADARGTCADADVISVRTTKAAAAATTPTHRCAGYAGAAPVAGQLDLLAIHGEVPLSIDRWLATDLPRLLVTPVTGTVALPATSVPDLLAVIGRRDATAGVIDGAIAVQGTIGTPTVPPSTLTVHGLEVAAGTSAKPPRLDELKITARWGGVTGQLDATGRESDGGELTAHAEGRPDIPGSIVAWLTVQRFDISPVAVFLPGPLVGSAGRLRGRVDLRGLDPKVGGLSGDLHLDDARIPLSSTIGTVRKGALAVTIRDHQIVTKLDGKLGGGSVHVDGTIRLAGITPDHVDATATLRKVTPIGSLEPIIDADVSAILSRNGGKWTGPVVISNGSVVVPESHSKKLLAVGAPSDLVPADAPKIEKVERVAPRDPWVVADVELHATEVQSEVFRGAIDGSFDLYIGDTVALDGKIRTVRGDAEILGRRYRIEHAVADFPGSLDPNLNIRIIHEFPEVELTAEINSSLSALLASPLRVIQTSTNPGGYSADQRLGFLLGGVPGGDPNTQSREAATAAGASIFSAYAQRYVKRLLPIDLDITVGYETATSTTSAAYTFGRWFNDRLYVGARHRNQARVDENATEFSVEYYLGERLLLDGTGGDHGYYGGDLLWRKRY